MQQYYNLETADAILQEYLSLMGKKFILINGCEQTLKRITVIHRKNLTLKFGAEKKYSVSFVFENFTIDSAIFYIMKNNKFFLN